MKWGTPAGSVTTSQNPSTASSPVQTNSPMANGLIGPRVNTSWDGTFMETGASPYGKKICGCSVLSNCNRSPQAIRPRRGMGLVQPYERSFYGYTGCFLVTAESTGAMRPRKSYLIPVPRLSMSTVGVKYAGTSLCQPNFRPTNQATLRYAKR